MSHMSTHHNRKTYHCTYSGCHKTYNDQNSLKHHCALRHGVRITPPSSDSPTSRREPLDTPAVSKLQSLNTDLRGFFNSPRKLISPNVAKSFSNPKETHPSQVKPSKRQPSWTLVAPSKSYDFKEREMLTTTQWTPSVPHTVKEYPVVISLNDRDFESSPDSLELFPRKMSSLEPSKVTASAAMGSSNASEAECSQQHCSIQVKKTLNKLKRKRPSFTSNHSALSSPETKSGLIADFPDPVIATLPSTPVIRTPSPVSEGRKRKYKDSEKVLTAPVPQSSPKRSQTQSPCLVSPSQEKGQKQKYKRKNSPVPIIPVSVPVTWAKAISSMSSPHSGEPLQTRKGLTQPTISSPPTSPKRTNDQEAQGPYGGCATRGRTSQLRSPIYLEEGRASPRFPPPPYTPPPMLSPHRPRTGSYFIALLQYQQYPPAAASHLADVDNTVISIKPRINIGSRFQAEIPPLRNTFYGMYEEHPAQLVWSPRKDLTTNRKTQKKVSELLDMCCSSVLIGGGTNIELALHCLHEVEGNIPAALDLLLMREDFRITGHPLNNYHYTGSDHWTDQEMRLFRKSLEDHGKDFNRIHNVV
ncbi:Zinc finger protein 541 [Triplophysa tibetana]|uniref:Zinc finger protein 541 n=1 Tax=Triplophysa tibetana TaxID=1572043 RepID=A0A5A9P3R4_9TELE|nr:Zinc finger protein 541 [Triplophysa tibetana]